MRLLKYARKVFLLATCLPFCLATNHVASDNRIAKQTASAAFVFCCCKMWIIAVDRMAIWWHWDWANQPIIVDPAVCSHSLTNMIIGHISMDIRGCQPYRQLQRLPLTKPSAFALFLFNWQSSHLGQKERKKVKLIDLHSQVQLIFVVYFTCFAC